MRKHLYTFSLAMAAVVASHLLPWLWRIATDSQSIPLGQAILLIALAGVAASGATSVAILATSGTYLDRWFRYLAHRLGGLDEQGLELENLRQLSAEILSKLKNPEAQRHKAGEALVLGYSIILANSHTKGVLLPGACRHCGMVHPNPESGNLLDPQYHAKDCVYAASPPVVALAKKEIAAQP